MTFTIFDVSQANIVTKRSTLLQSWIQKRKNTMFWRCGCCSHRKMENNKTNVKLLISVVIAYVPLVVFSFLLFRHLSLTWMGIFFSFPAIVLYKVFCARIIFNVAKRRHFFWHLVTHGNDETRYLMVKNKGAVVYPLTGIHIIEMCGCGRQSVIIH